MHVYATRTLTTAAVDSLPFRLRKRLAVQAVSRLSVHTEALSTGPVAAGTLHGTEVSVRLAANVRKLLPLHLAVGEVLRNGWG